MIVFIDTNILVSAVLYPGSVSSKAYNKAVNEPYQAIVCEQNINELIRVFNRKFPSKRDRLTEFLSVVITMLTVVPTPDSETEEEDLVRDIADRPILRSAIKAGADILLTGDKDFLESGIENPKILTPVQFLEMQQ